MFAIKKAAAVTLIAAGAAMMTYGLTAGPSASAANLAPTATTQAS